jgi:hypothetical protein
MYLDAILMKKGKNNMNANEYTGNNMIANKNKHKTSNTLSKQYLSY